MTQSIESPTVRYNFANNYIDPVSFPTKLWRRYLNRALKNKDLLAGYGEPQGETALRRTLAKYSSAARGVICTPEQIVIGAGVQSLLQILIDILQPDITGIALEAPGFAQAERLFASHGWQVSHFSTEQLEAALPRLLYVSPSNPYKVRSMSPQQRLALLRWAARQQAYLLEDDYNGEFRYFSRPVSSLQGMSDGSTVIYLGSFSRLLLPSLRISYMVLPPLLLERYRQLGHLYNQTSSTIEQLALADFIDVGALRRHVKRLRKLYSSKNVLLRQALAEIFGNKIIVRAYESRLH
ncbi:MAG: PLP-dependent aminotransferase family protein, partial [Acidaminococcaceae bacterium]|nr:PLP-dependent aminotransferase family protein [Acidaminococcaceae bacterium]